MNILKATPVFGKLCDLWDDYRFIVMEGGSRSSKTYSLLQKIILECIKTPKPLRVAIVRSTLAKLKTSLFPDFESILRDDFKIWDRHSLNKSDWTYELNGSVITFVGLDNEAGLEKAHGMKTDICFFNECPEISFEIVWHIMTRNPGKIVFDLNPNIGEEHWVYSRILTLPDSISFTSTFEDNPYLEESIKKLIRSTEPTPENIARGTVDEAYWKVYGLGIRAQVEGLVFPDFEIASNMPETIEKECFGMDFGFSVDPTTLIRVVLCDGCLYYDELIYETGLTNIVNPHNKEQNAIEKRLIELKIPRAIPIYADSAEPKSITDLCNAKFNVIPVVKGAGSIHDGIMTMKRYKIYVTARSTHLIEEFKNYKWHIERSGKPTNKPVDKWNHCIDGARYATIMGLDIDIYHEHKFMSAPRPKEEDVLGW